MTEKDKEGGLSVCMSTTDASKIYSAAFAECELVRSVCEHEQMY